MQSITWKYSVEEPAAIGNDVKDGEGIWERGIIDEKIRY